MIRVRGIRNAASIMAGSFFNKLISLVALAWLTWYLGPADFGRYSFIVAYMAFFGIFTDLGVNTHTAREISTGRVDRAKAFGDAIVLRLVFTVFTVAASLALLPLFGYGPGMVELGMAASLALLFSFRGLFFRNVFEIPFVSNLRMHRPALVNFANELLVLAVLMVEVRREAPLVELLAAMNLAYIPGFAVMARSAFRELPPVVSFDPASWRRLLGHAVPLGMSSLVEGLFLIIPLMVLSMHSTDISLGLYSLPLRVASSLWIIPVAVMVTLLPMMSRDAVLENGGLKGGFLKGLRFMVAVGFMLALAADLYSDTLVDFIAGESFGESSRVLSVMAWGTFFYFVNSTFFYTFTAAGHHFLGTWSWSVVTVVCLVSGLLLIPRFGHMGAAYVFTLSLVAGFVANLVMVPRFFGVGISVLFFDKREPLLKE